MKQLSNLALALLLVGCATTYQKEGFFSNGYSDSRMTNDTFVITFRASEFTSEETVKEYALRRSAEVTLKKGYRYFVILDQKTYLHTPSVRFSIQCFTELPPGRDAMDAKVYI